MVRTWDGCFFSFFLLFFPSVKICTIIDKSVSYAYIQSAAAAAAALSVPTSILLLLLQQPCCCFPLLFVIVCWMAKTVAGPLNLTPVFSFSSSKRDVIPDGTPWQYCVTFMASICLHPRYLPACAEPRRASARRGDSPLRVAVNGPFFFRVLQKFHENANQMRRVL